MLWNFLKTHQRIGSGIFLLVSVFVSFFFFCLNTTSVFAVSDVTFTVNPGDTVYICGSNSNYLCQDYSYIIFSPQSPSSNAYLGISFGGINLRLPNFSDSILYISSNVYGSFFQLSSTPTVSSVIITLTDSLPSTNCPVCEECQVCPAIPDNPYDDKFDRIIVAIYTVGGILLVIYFFYGIYRMIIRSSKGGN